MTSAAVSSQQVNWWTVHEYIAPVLAQVGSWPTAGTPEWCALADDDPIKLAALLDASQHWALQVETCQEAHCAASREVGEVAYWVPDDVDLTSGSVGPEVKSKAVEWSALSREILVRTEFYAARPWLKRVAS